MVIMQAILFAVIAQGATVAVARPDFTGTWDLSDVRTRSNNAQLAKQLATEKLLTIKQTAQNLSISRQEPAKMIERYTFDGKGNTNITWVGERLTLSRGIDVMMDNKPTRFDAKEVWSLSDNRKTLTIDLTVSTPEGNAIYRLAYTKAAS